MKCNLDFILIFGFIIFFEIKCKFNFIFFKGLFIFFEMKCKVDFIFLFGFIIFLVIKCKRGLNKIFLGSSFSFFVFEEERKFSFSFLLRK